MARRKQVRVLQLVQTIAAGARWTVDVHAVAGAVSVPATAACDEGAEGGPVYTWAESDYVTDGRCPSCIAGACAQDVSVRAAHHVVIVVHAAPPAHLRGVLGVPYAVGET